MAFTRVTTILVHFLLLYCIHTVEALSTDVAQLINFFFC